ncbi:MAG: response regulator [Actinobacteria bacterium]|nr:response regulator [Actinomycetota bacterium]
MDLNTPELTRIFRAELEERSSRLVLGARELAKKTLGNASIPDLIRDAHTIRGSAGLLGHDAISEVGARLETLWQMVGEGYVPESGVIIAMEAAAGRLVVAFDSQDDETLAELAEKLDSTVEHSEMTTDVVAIRRPEEGNLGGLLESVSASLLGGATRVDTGDLYLLINRIVEVKLDAEALADLSLVSIEGADQDLFRRSWRGQLERLSSSVSDIQDQAVSLANVSFFEAVASVPQFVRYLARRMDKDVRFRLSGDDVLLDRQIVDLIREPLRHLLVNAVDHGIEAPQVRIAAGKTPTATVAIGATAIAEGVEIYVSDDGAGIDWDRVAEVGNESGLTVTPPDLSPLLFHPGFSTVKEITDFSGSGDGLSEALLAVERVNGALHIESAKGKGTLVTMTLPLSMVLQNVVVVALGDQFWGLPEAAVEASMSLAKAELSTTTSGRAVRFRSAAIPCVSLSLAVGAPEPSNESELLIVSTRSGMVAVTVSEIVDRRRVAVKNLGPILEGAGHITGAALLGGGQVLVVLDPSFLGAFARQQPRLVEEKPRVLVVDDSAGVRRLLSATLNGAGFEVEVASGAREAMVAMVSDGFDAMVVDYSMPRSNGVELVRAMRAAEIKVPIIMVSGVATEEEKKAAWEVGVDAYLDKFDLRQGVLTKTLRQLIGLDDADTA